MSRVIKFRAWDRKKGEMLGLSADTGYSLQLRDETYLIVANVGNGETYPKVFFEDCILMQFTGLTDKNGKEIYEEDVVRENGLVSKVSWNEKRARFVLKFAEGKEYTEWAVLKTSALEVIGNIYENPETL